MKRQSRISCQCGAPILGRLLDGLCREIRRAFCCFGSHLCGGD